MHDRARRSRCQTSLKRLAAGLLAAMAVAGLGLAGCGGADGSKSTASIGSFSLIEVGKTHVQVAADGTSAVVEVETGSPTVCAIAYGKTASGSIADDPNMGGTAISHHVVVLSGLIPGADVSVPPDCHRRDKDVCSRPEIGHVHHSRRAWLRSGT